MDSGAIPTPTTSPVKRRSIAAPVVKAQRTKKTPLYLAGEFGNVESLARQLKDPKTQAVIEEFYDGWSPLHASCANGHYPCVKMLLDAGASVSIVTRDNERRTPLHLAVEFNHPRVVALLLERKADPSALDAHAATPLLYAEGVGSPEIFKLLEAALAAQNSAVSVPNVQSMLYDSNGSTDPASGPHKGSYYEEACALADGSQDEPVNDVDHDEDVFWEMGKRGSTSEPRGSAAIEDDDSEAEPEREAVVPQEDLAALDRTQLLELVLKQQGRLTNLETTVHELKHAINLQAATAVPNISDIEQQRLVDLEEQIELREQHLGQVEALVSDMVASGIALPRASPEPTTTIDPNDDGDLSIIMIKCTMCGERVPTEELGDHMERCEEIRRSREIDAQSLAVNVSFPDLTPAQAKAGLSFRIITKTEMTSFNGKRHVVLRTMEECLWLQRALQLKHYSRIVPPISEPPAIPQDDPSLFERIVQAHVYVVQQFFTRICAHKILRTDALLRLFLVTPHTKILYHDLELLLPRTSLDKFRPEAIAPTTPHRSSNDVVLDKTKEYLQKQHKMLIDLSRRLGARIAFLELQRREIAIDEHLFNDVAQTELTPSSSYVSLACSTIAGVYGSIRRSNDQMEQLVALRESIDGIAMYLVCARASFLRLEQSLVDVANIGTQVMSQSGASDAALAAQMARLNEAALRLEGLNKNIMDEVRLFDALKTIELRNLFIDYATDEMQREQQLMVKWRSALHTVSMFQIAANVALLSASTTLQHTSTPEA